jgi:hypothetical protein
MFYGILYVMKPNIDSWTIVVAGAWNAQIFKPDWVCEHLFGVKELEIQFNLHGSSVFPSLKTSEIIFSPTDNQVVCGIRNIKDSTLIKAEELVIKVLSMLSHTPINAVGVNFSFSDENPSDKLLNLFDFNDTVSFSDHNFIVKESQVYRQIEHNDFTLNLRQTIGTDPPSAMFSHFNFQKEVSDTNDASHWLKGKVLECKSTAYKLVKEIYNTEITEDDDVE